MPINGKLKLGNQTVKPNTFIKMFQNDNNNNNKKIN